MCGRYYIGDEESNIELREIINEINRKHYGTPELETMKTGEIFPTNRAPVLSAEGATIMKWGFPSYSGAKPVINARAETVFEKNMFKRAIADFRIVIPTSGFYEWTHTGNKTKEKYLFTLPDDKVVYLAAICARFTSSDGSSFPHYTILTTEANESMSPFHSRMPVYLHKRECDAWINDPNATRDILLRAQPSYAAQSVTARQLTFL